MLLKGDKIKFCGKLGEVVSERPREINGNMMCEVKLEGRIGSIFVCESDLQCDNTCRMEYITESVAAVQDLYECSACGAAVRLPDNYCPHCGRKIVDDED